MGFHSHNNLQLSFSNSQEFFEYVGDRVISLDASIYGMGRGAGNLNTELIANYVNDREGHMYAIEPLLEVVDEFIIHIRQKHEWGILFLIIWRLLMVVILIMPLIWLRNRRLL